ncbi:hypothetical protein M404DRAFT_25736 [Pisolithus tinctorius Marx 270]|uniref:Uncharacterized protein n=1 Tax=Pisolithus tinctorius Marx 270 TaxID=870435 RepID=A0A0C3K691_PISTI|nr:hypothetical protein M404DRAFT_25736 [Pisolithus tinctorius Marx 270]
MDVVRPHHQDFSGPSRDTQLPTEESSADHDLTQHLEYFIRSLCVPRGPTSPVLHPTRPCSPNPPPGRWPVGPAQPSVPASQRMPPLYPCEPERPADRDRPGIAVVLPQSTIVTGKIAIIANVPNIRVTPHSSPTMLPALQALTML